MRSRSATASTTARRPLFSTEPNPSPTASTSTAQIPIKEEEEASSTHSRHDPRFENEKEYFGMGHKLKRIFIGPSFEGMANSSSWKRKGKMKAEPSDSQHHLSHGDGESLWEDEGGSESDASSNWERVERKRKGPRGIRAGRQEVSELTQFSGHSAIPRSRRPSVHDWKGNSFEIGADMKEMIRRREKRLTAEREDREKREAQEEEEAKFLKMHLRGRTNSSATSASTTFQSNASFVTARSDNPLSAPPPSPAAFRLNQPPLHIEEKYPEITHTLCRRSSNPPRLERSTSDTPAILVSAQPTTPIRSILRTKDSSYLNGSAVGNGHPLQAPSSLLDVPTSLPSVPPRLSLKPPPFTRREPSTATSVRFPDLPSRALQDPEVPTGDQPPAPPQEVLSRPAPQVNIQENKVKDPRPFIRAAADKMLHRKKRGDEVLRKERMLVRDDWSQRDVCSQSPSSGLIALTDSLNLRNLPGPAEIFR